MLKDMTDDQYSQQGDYLASLSEDYYYAMHPEEAPYKMSEWERETIKLEYARQLEAQAARLKVSGAYAATKAGRK